MGSGLPSYEVYFNNDLTTLINLSTFGDNYDDMDDYFDALRKRGTTMRRVSLDPKTLPQRRAEIIFLDTPGIEDTTDRMRSMPRPSLKESSSWVL